MKTHFNSIFKGFQTFHERVITINEIVDTRQESIFITTHNS